MITPCNDRGHTPVSTEEVFKLYGGTHIPAHFLNPTAADGRNIRLKQFIDMFSIPEATLLADTSEVREPLYMYLLTCKLALANDSGIERGQVGRGVAWVCRYDVTTRFILFFNSIC